MILIIVPLLSLMTIILTHEWGHFIVAKFHNVRVDEFAIGMGHKLIAYTDP
jgi:regulator of sigma E protease